ncbi:MAG: hypothetical protein WCR29_01615 [Bacteroidales bacterium]
MDFNKLYKPIFNIVLAIGLIVFFSSVSCDPETESPNSITLHQIKNNTTEDIILNIIPTRNPVADSVFHIPKGSSFTVRKGSFFLEKTSPFDVLYYFFNEDQDMNVYVYSKDSILLKAWNRFYADSTQKQFFKESDWTKKEYEKDEGIIYKYHEYTFTINQEDIDK